MFFEADHAIPEVIIWQLLDSTTPSLARESNDNGTADEEVEDNKDEDGAVGVIPRAIRLHELK